MGMAVFGLFWWYLGPLTLLPRVLRGVIDWRMEEISALLPLLPGHLIYGATTAFIFLLFERRFTRWLGRPPARCTGTASGTACGNTSAGCLVVRSGIGCTLAYSARITKALLVRSHSGQGALLINT